MIFYCIYVILNHLCGVFVMNIIGMVFKMRKLLTFLSIDVMIYDYPTDTGSLRRILPSGNMKYWGLLHLFKLLFLFNRFWFSITKYFYQLYDFVFVIGFTIPFRSKERFKN